MEAQQCVERTRTNRPRAYPSWRSGWWRKGDLQDTVFGFEGMSPFYNIVFMGYSTENSFFYYLLTLMIIYDIMAIVECG